MSHVISERELKQQFDDYLDEIYPDVEICGYHYNASNALKDVDPVAYNESFNNYMDSMGYVEHTDEDGDFDGWIHEDELESQVC